jgi:hypothetical protein
MKNIQIQCVINYEIKDGKITSQLIPQLAETFDFNSLEEILKEYRPIIVSKEEEIEALKKITDMLLIHIEDKILWQKEKIKHHAY